MPCLQSESHLLESLEDIQSHYFGCLKYEEREHFWCDGNVWAAAQKLAEEEKPSIPWLDEADIHIDTQKASVKYACALRLEEEYKRLYIIREQLKRNKSGERLVQNLEESAEGWKNWCAKKKHMDTVRSVNTKGRRKMAHSKETGGQETSSKVVGVNSNLPAIPEETSPAGLAATSSVEQEGNTLGDPRTENLGAKDQHMAGCGCRRGIDEEDPGEGMYWAAIEAIWRVIEAKGSSSSVPPKTEAPRPLKPRASDPSSSEGLHTGKTSSQGYHPETVYDEQNQKGKPSPRTSNDTPPSSWKVSFDIDEDAKAMTLFMQPGGHGLMVPKPMPIGNLYRGQYPDQYISMKNLFDNEFVGREDFIQKWAEVQARDPVARPFEEGLIRYFHMSFTNMVVSWLYSEHCKPMLTFAVGEGIYAKTNRPAH